MSQQQLTESSVVTFSDFSHSFIATVILRNEIEFGISLKLSLYYVKYVIYEGNFLVIFQ